MTLSEREEAQLARLTKISSPKSAIDLANKSADAGGRVALPKSGSAVSIKVLVSPRFDFVEA